MTHALVDTWALHIAHCRAARTFLEACAAADIPALPVKGIVAAYVLYADPAERVLSDVDVRIRHRDFQRVGELAKRRHWAVREVKLSYGNYVLDVDHVDVDVECAIGPPHVCALRVEDMLARATRSDLLGFPALIPSFVDHVVLQMVNVFKDKLTRARNAAIRDLERIAAHAEFDARLIAERLRESRVTTIGWIVSDFAARDLAIPRWAEVRDALGPLRRPLYARAMRRAREQPEGLAAIILARIGADDPLERVRAMTTMARWSLEKRRPK